MVICGIPTNGVIVMKFSTLAAQAVVILSIIDAAGDENFLSMKTFQFQWRYASK